MPMCDPRTNIFPCINTKLSIHFSWLIMSFSLKDIHEVNLFFECLGSNEIKKKELKKLSTEAAGCWRCLQISWLQIKRWINYRWSHSRLKKPTLAVFLFKIWDHLNIFKRLSHIKLCILLYEYMSVCKRAVERAISLI